MSKDEYLLIRSALHFVDNDAADKTDKLYKLRPLMDKVQNLYTEIYLKQYTSICHNKKYI